MHALLERLSPAERTAFVLHDVFQYPFDDIAAIVGRSPAACRQLASRARRTLRATSAAGRFPVDAASSRRVSERFIEACAGGDLDGLLSLLDPAVDGAGDIAPEVVVGADRGRPPASCATSARPSAPTLVHLPVGDRVGHRRPPRPSGAGPRAADDRGRPRRPRRRVRRGRPQGRGQRRRSDWPEPSGRARRGRPERARDGPAVRPTSVVVGSAARTGAARAEGGHEVVGAGLG